MDIVEQLREKWLRDGYKPASMDKAADEIESLRNELSVYEANERRFIDADESLRQQLATQKAYYESVMEDGSKRIRELTEQASASQAREQRLCEALIYTQQATCLAADDAPDSPIGKLYAVVSSAVEQPTDTTALEAMIQKAGEVMRERCAEQAYLLSGIATNAIRALPGVTMEDLK